MSCRDLYNAAVWPASAWHKRANGGAATRDVIPGEAEKWCGTHRIKPDPLHPMKGWSLGPVLLWQRGVSPPPDVATPSV